MPNGGRRWTVRDLRPQAAESTGRPRRHRSLGRSGPPARRRSSGGTSAIRSSAGTICWVSKASITVRAPYGDGFVGVFGSKRKLDFLISTSAEATMASIGTSSRKPSSSPAVTPARRAITPTTRVVKIEILTTSPGAADIAGRRSASPPPRTFSGSTGSKMRSCRSIAMVYWFPRKIGGKFMMLSRPSDNGYTPFGDIYLSQSPDMCHWGMHRLVMRRGGDQVGQWWQRTKIGSLAPFLDRDRGRLALDLSRRDRHLQRLRLQHGGAILDREEPWRVPHRTNQHIMTPEADDQVHRPRAERGVSVCGAVRSHGQAFGRRRRRG